MKAKKVVPSIIGVSAVIAPVVSTSVSCSSNWVDIKNFDKPKARIDQELLSDKNLSTIENQYINDVNKENSIWINDCFWSIRQFFETYISEGWMKNAKAAISNFSINESNEISFNFKFEYKLEGKIGETRFSAEEKWDIYFQNIPVHLSYDNLGGYWWLGTSLWDSYEAENNSNWKIHVNNYSYTVESPYESINHKINDVTFKQDALTFEDRWGASWPYTKFLSWSEIQRMSYLSEIVPNIMLAPF